MGRDGRRAADRAVRGARPRRRPRGPAPAPRPGAVAEPGAGAGLGAGHGPGLPPRARRLLARGLRLAGAGASPQSARPLLDEDRWAANPLRTRLLSPRGCLAARAQPRLAGVDRRVSRRFRAAHQPARSRRRLPRRGPFAAGVRVLRPDLRAGLAPAPHGPGLHGSDGPARLHAVRRAGWRTGGRW